MHRAKLFLANATLAISVLFLLSTNAFAQLSTRVLTIKTTPADTVLQSVFVDGQRANIISNQNGYTFIEIRGETHNFGCKYTLSIIAENGRFLRKQYDLCESVWQINVSFEDDGSGASQKQISIVPSDPKVRIYSMSLNGQPQSFTAFMDSNRVEFTLKRGPSGYKCTTQLEALLSNGNRFNEKVDLCANDNEVVLDLAPKREYFEVFTVRSSQTDDRISSVSVDGRKVPILRWIAGGVRTRLAVGAPAFKCEATVGVEFASGAKASDKLDICAQNFDVTLTPTPQYLTDTSLASPFTWRFTAPRDANDNAQLRFASNNRAAGFVAVCQPGSRNADLYLTGFPARAGLSSRSVLQMWAGRYQGKQNAFGGRAPYGPNLTAPFFNLTTQHGLWNGLISGSAFTIIANDDHRLRLSLKGSADPVRNFIRACNQRFNGPSVIGDVTGDVSLKWSRTTIQNGGQQLQFGDANTDRIGLAARCERESGFAEVMFASAPPNMADNRNVEIFWDTIGNQGKLTARTRTVQGIEWGAVPVAGMDIDDPFWASLAAGNVVHIAMDGDRMSTYSLKGSAKPVREFVAACRPYEAAPVAEPIDNLTPDRPSAEEQVFNSIADIFNNLSAQSDGKIKVEIGRTSSAAQAVLQAYQNSPDFLCTQTDLPTPLGQRQVKSSFVNNGSNSYDLFQIQPNGQRVRVRDVPPGARLTVDAREGQSWEVRRPGGRCIATYASPNKDVTFSIKDKMDRADPSAFVKSYQCDDGSRAQVLIAPNHGFAIIDERYAVHRASVAGRSQNIFGGTSAIINDQQLVLRGNNAPGLDCVAQ
ncbi:hypothetical protein [Maritalea porphyrae]|uniref:hypothetical protein n=1 Tax=Maritalea porphyrae TaxID=880732 RepID=UPI0022AF03BB|nr:hypothetical protein [Maritalea porphyrae]MCZ4272130.1 hypothetical protein [Maritalea porphyrae]